MLRFACIHGIQYVCIPVHMYSRDLQEHATICQLHKVHVASRPEFNALSNGALAFAVNLILCTENGGNRSYIQPPFLAVRTALI